MRNEGINVQGFLSRKKGNNIFIIILKIQIMHKDCYLLTHANFYNPLDMGYLIIV